MKEKGTVFGGIVYIILHTVVFLLMFTFLSVLSFVYIVSDDIINFTYYLCTVGGGLLFLAIDYIVYTLMKNKNFFTDGHTKLLVSLDAVILFVSSVLWFTVFIISGPELSFTCLILLLVFTIISFLFLFAHLRSTVYLWQSNLQDTKRYLGALAQLYCAFIPALNLVLILMGLLYLLIKKEFSELKRILKSSIVILLLGGLLALCCILLIKTTPAITYLGYDMLLYGIPMMICLQMKTGGNTVDGSMC